MDDEFATATTTIQNRRTRISSIGLTGKETTVVSSMWSLLPKLRETSEFLSPSQAKRCDILLVNADLPKAMCYWHKIHAHRPMASAIMVTTQPADVDGPCLKRPIRIRDFALELERIISIAPKVLHDNATPTVHSQNRLRILIVDDSFSVRKYMEHKLPLLYWRPAVFSFAESGEEALKKVANEPFDLAFVDVMMPGIDGYTVCKKIKSRYSIRVVMLTSRKSPFDKARGLMSGCDSFISKPPTDKALANELDKAARHLLNSGRTATQCQVVA